MILKIQGKCISKDNSKIMNRQGRYFLTKEFKEFEKNIASQVIKQLPDGFKPFTKDLRVGMSFFMIDKRHADLTNLPKSILDSLQGLVYKNDKQIKECYLFLQYHEFAGVTMDIEEIEDDTERAVYADK